MKKIRDALWEKAVSKKFPLIAAFELLPVCNLSCKMCYVRKTMKEVNEQGGLLDAKSWLDFAAQAKDLGLLYPLLTGGEPLLHPEFKEIFSGMQKMGMQVSINSNGTMIDEEMAKWFSECTPTRINITLYGASEKSYQDLCGDGNAFNKVRAAVDHLQKYHIPIKFNASITPQNYHELKLIMDYAESVHVPLQIATYMFPPLRRDETMIGKNVRLSPQQAAEACFQSELLRNEPEWMVQKAIRFSEFIDPEKIGPPDQIMKMYCRAGVCSFWIDWQGNMMNCGMYPSAKTSLEKKTLKQAWGIIVDKTSKVEYTPYCASCPNRVLCHACIAMVVNECGNDAGKPEYLCEMNKHLAHLYKEYLAGIDMNVYFGNRNNDNENKDAIDIYQDDSCGF